MLQFLYAVPAVLITYILFRKGKLDYVGKTSLASLAVAGMVLPLVDVIQTLIALEYGLEGNPIIIMTPSGYQVALLLVSHIGYAIFALLLGWMGKSQEKVWARTVLVFLVIYLVLLVVINIISMLSHGILQQTDLWD